jgi:hypothetical protein
MGHWIDRELLTSPLDSWSLRETSCDLVVSLEMCFGTMVVERMEGQIVVGVILLVRMLAGESVQVICTSWCPFRVVPTIILKEFLIESSATATSYSM